MAGKLDERNAATDGLHIEQIGHAERGETALDLGRSYKGYVFYRREEIEEAKECFRKIRRNSLDCNGARNAGKESYLPCVECAVWDRAYEAGLRSMSLLKLAS